MFLPNFATLRNVIAAEIWSLARPDCGLTTGCSGRPAARPAAEPERWADGRGAKEAKLEVPAGAPLGPRPSDRMRHAAVDAAKVLAFRVLHMRSIPTRRR
jgi:hypothetical protein